MALCLRSVGLPVSVPRLLAYVPSVPYVDFNRSEGELVTFEKPDPNSPTWKVVGGLLGLGLVAFFWFVLTLPRFIAATLLLAYEAWTFFNRYKHDTISEVIWELVKRPLVPFILGAGSVALISHGVIQPTIEGLYVAFAVGMLMGHFCFQRQAD